MEYPKILNCLCMSDTEWLIDHLRTASVCWGHQRCFLNVWVNMCSCHLLQGYMMKKGHKRKNWTERWFLLKPNRISYYASEDLTEKKGDILLDGNCCVEVRSLLVSLVVSLLKVLFTCFLFWWPYIFFCSLYQIRKGKSAFSTSSAWTKALRSAPQIRRKNRSGFKVGCD